MTASQVISVGSLLRREGRAPHAQDRPMQPRAARQAEQPGTWPEVWPARPTSGRRRATAVAGALVATGSVLGAALYNGAASNSSEAQAAADGLFPGLGLPAAAPANALPAGFLPANVSLTSPLPDVLSPGGTDWARLAFPGTLPGSTAAGTLTAASTMPRSMRTAVPAARSAAAESVPAQRGGGTGGVLPSLPVVSPPGRTPAGNVLDPVLGGGVPAADDPSGAGSGPVRDVTETLRPAGNAVGGVLRPVSEAASPVGATVGGVVAPVGRTLTPVTNTLRPVTRPVADAVEPVTSAALGGLEPVTGPVLNGTRPLTGPVLDSLGPVTGLLDTSAKGKNNPVSGRHALTSDTDPANTVAGLTAKAGTTLGGLTGKNGTGRAKNADATGLGGVLSGVGSSGLLGGSGSTSGTGTKSGTSTMSGNDTKSGDDTDKGTGTNTGTSGAGSALGGVSGALGGLAGQG